MTKIKENDDNYKVEPMTEEEVRKQVKKLKKEQTAGKDGIPKEACLKAPDNVIRRKTEIVNEVWMGESIPKQWSEGIICSIYKKGEGN